MADVICIRFFRRLRVVRHLSEREIERRAHEHRVRGMMPVVEPIDPPIEVKR